MRARLFNMLILILAGGIAFPVFGEIEKSDIDPLLKQLKGTGCYYRMEHRFESVGVKNRCITLSYFGLFFERIFETRLKQDCMRDAARCLAKTDLMPEKVVPVLIEQLKTGPDQHNMGDGVISVRPEIIKALGRHPERKEVVSSLEEVLKGTSSTESKVAALEMLSGAAPFTESTVRTLISSFETGDERVRVHAFEKLLKIQNEKAIAFVKKEVTTSKFPYLFSLRFADNMYDPLLARNFEDEIRFILSIVSDEKLWNEKLAATSTVDEAKEVFRIRKSLWSNIRRPVKNIGIPDSEIREVEPGENWEKVLSQRLESLR